MDGAREDADRYFTTIDQNLTDGYLAVQIWQALQFFAEVEEFVFAETGEHLKLPDEDVAVLRRWAQDPDAAIRKAAIEALIALGYVRWEDLACWGSDEVEDIRWGLLDPSPGEPLQTLYDSEPDQYIRILIKAAELRADYTAGRILRDLSADDQRLERIWPEMERLLDIADPDLTTMVMVTYFEDVITEHNWGPNDRHLTSWMDGSKPNRQWVLLGIASYMGLHEGKLKAIVEALSHAQHPDIAAVAREMLHGKKYHEAVETVNGKKG